jgi:pilus assembly protein Flp/PilA
MAYSKCARRVTILNRTGSQLPPGDGESPPQFGSDTSMISTYEFLATWLRARFSDAERGASLVEYALLVALIAVVCIIAVRILGSEASETFSSTASNINAG